MNYNDKNFKEKIRRKIRNFPRSYLFTISILLIVSSGIIFGGMEIVNLLNNRKILVKDSKSIDEEKILIEEKVYDYIYSLRLEHPDIVMAQCILESGNFSSEIFLEGNNCLGMKVPQIRPTLCTGTYKGHAKFSSVRDCISDYAIWQSIYCKGLTREEYFKYLDKVYSQVDDYSERLKRVIKSRNL